MNRFCTRNSQRGPSVVVCPASRAKKMTVSGHFKIHKNLRSGFNIKTVEVHHLAPGSHKVFHKLVFCVGAGINLCKGPKL